MTERITKSIKRLKKEKKAIILVHNYQIPEVQDIADYLGDSLELSLIASRTEAKVIVFCGVKFMAETAAIVCPDKKVLLPDINAGCPMADMVRPEELRELKAKHPEAIVVCYVNTSADVKAESDICCTSANSVKIVNSIPREKQIIFIPDQYLADYTARKTQRKLIIWEGYCPIHLKITAEGILRQKQKYPGSVSIVHPECTPQVIDIADEVGSTSAIMRFAKETKAKKIIIGTEIGIIYRLKKENPDKDFYPADEKAICSNMKLITLEKILWSLEDEKNEVKVEERIRRKAFSAVQKMLETK